jgi:hypothetical protein
MNELNSLSNCIKQLSSLSKNNKINIEIIGERIDMYQNILPLLFEINILITGSLNQYNEIINSTEFKTDVILIDGPGNQLTECENYIEFDEEKKEYQLIKRKKMDITEVYKSFKSNGFYYY